MKKEKNGQVKLIKDFAVGLSAAAREKRESIDIRLAETKRIIDESPDEHFIIWHDLESERHAIKHAIPEAKFIYGSQNMEEREKNTIGFSRGDFRILATKKSFQEAGVTSKNIVIDRYSWELTMNLMTSFRQYTGVTASCKQNLSS